MDELADLKLSMQPRTVLINGLGNIGTTLANLLLHYQQQLNISRVILYKNQPQAWQTPALKALADQGAKVVTATPLAGFCQRDYIDVLAEADYVFETREHGLGMAEKDRYAALIADTNHPLQHACSQGSEKHFGVPFMAGLDPSAIAGQPFATVVSCNTHAIAAVLRTICGAALEDLIHADAVVVRRSEDLGSSGRLVGANVVARHLDPTIGTHHAIDACDLFNSLGISASITSSDITTPSQAMHAMRFNVQLKPSSTDLIAIRNRLAQQPFLATTALFDSGEIHSLGRRYGFQGRIFAHAIVVENQLLLQDNRLIGWAFVPQEACTLLSTLAAYLHQTQQYDEGIFQSIVQQLVAPQF